MQIIKILIPQVALFSLDYQISSEVVTSVGDLVVVPFRNKKITGIVWETNCPDTSGKKLKTIEFNDSESLNISAKNIQLIKKVSDYYLSSLGGIAKLVLPVDVNEKPIKYESQEIPANIMLAELSEEQKSAIDYINKQTKPVLLKGVTGSGKTEVYFHLVADCIKAGKQVLIMLPEIALSSQIIDRFTKRFGFKPAVWNSSITKARKKKLLRGIISGNIKMVIGARSSLFLPYPDLGLVVVDEEHDASYKQSEGILYNARDMAVFKGHLFDFKILLVSATPSIETIYNAQQGKYEIFELKNRFKDASMPVAEIIDMRECETKSSSWRGSEEGLFTEKNVIPEPKRTSALALSGEFWYPGSQEVGAIPVVSPEIPDSKSHNAQAGYSTLRRNDDYSKSLNTNPRPPRHDGRGWLSSALIDAIKTTIAQGNQCLLFLNRRGYAPLMLCKSCGFRFGCGKCSASMVIHKAHKRMECHHCGAISKIHDKCPECKEPDSLVMCGPGIERIFEETQQIFPNLRIKMASKEQSEKPEEMEELLKEMESGEIDILIGTQIITKGHHFPKLALVGVVDADLGFVGGDLRSAEKTFQLLHQVGGRAGRERGIKGRVLLQSYFPENKVLRALVNGDEEEFIQQEILSREEANMPPFTKMAAINITGKSEEKTLSMAKYIAKKAPTSSATILGPAESLMFKLAGRYRYRILVIAQKKFNLQKYLSIWLDSCSVPSAFQVKVDVDPYSFY